jgi:hypothetical protein
MMAPPIPYGEYAKDYHGAIYGPAAHVVHSGIGLIHKAGACVHGLASGACAICNHGACGSGACGHGHGSAGNCETPAQIPGAAPAVIDGSAPGVSHIGAPVDNGNRSRVIPASHQVSTSPQVVAVPCAACNGVGNFGSGSKCGGCGGLGFIKKLSHHGAAASTINTAACAHGSCGTDGCGAGACGGCGKLGCGGLCGLAAGHIAGAKGKVHGAIGHFTKFLPGHGVKYFVGPGGPVPITPGYVPYVVPVRSPRDYFAFPPYGNGVP